MKIANTLALTAVLLGALLCSGCAGILDKPPFPSQALNFAQTKEQACHDWMAGFEYTKNLQVAKCSNDAWMYYCRLEASCDLDVARWQLEQREIIADEVDRHVLTQEQGNAQMAKVKAEAEAKTAAWLKANPQGHPTPQTAEEAKNWPPHQPKPARYVTDVVDPIGQIN